MKVFLTGAGGFIGIHLKRALTGAGHHVTTHSPSMDGPLTGVPEDMEVVINSAGRLGGQGHGESALREANYNVPVLLCDHCSRHDVHLIHLSTPGVSGLVANGGESDPYAPGGSYETTKAEAEAHLREHLPSAVILRPDFVFGPGDMHKYPLFRQVSRGWFPLVGSGSARTRPTDVRDVCSGVLQAFPGGILTGGIWNLGGPEVLTVKELVQTMAEAMCRELRTLPIPRWVYRAALALGPLKPRNLSESRYRLFGTDRFTNTEKALRAGFQARYRFTETASDACEWYRERGLL